MKRRVLSLFLSLSLVPACGLSVLAANRYWAPAVQGDGSNYWWKEPGNWLDDNGATGVPQADDVIVFDSRATKLCYTMVDTVLDGALFRKTQTLSQGKQLTLKCGGTGLAVAGAYSITIYGGLSLSGSGEVALEIPAGATVFVQQGVVGAQATLVKRGDGLLTIGEYKDTGNRKCTYAATRLEAGTIQLNLLSKYWPSGHHLTFAGNGAQLLLKNVSLEMKDVVIDEDPSVDAATHAITSTTGSTNLVLTLSGSLDDMSFGGRLEGQAGVAWNPADATKTLTFRKAVSGSGGDLSVLNGTIRLSEGAKMKSLSSVTVGETGILAVEAGCELSPDELVVRAGGKVSLGSGVVLSVGSVARVGNMLLPGGTYTKANADWIEGDGVVSVPGADAIVWSGLGATTALSDMGNWYGGVPALTDGSFQAQFALDGQVATVTTDDVFLKGIDFTRSGFSLQAGDGAGTVRLGDGGVILVAGSSSATLAVPVMLEAAQTWSIGSVDGTITVSAPVASSATAGTLCREGKGTLLFTAGNTMTNDLVLKGGKTVFAGDGTAGAAPGQTIVRKGASVEFRGGVQTRPLYFEQDPGGSFGCFTNVFAGLVTATNTLTSNPSKGGLVVYAGGLTVKDAVGGGNRPLNINGEGETWITNVAPYVSDRLTLYPGSTVRIGVANGNYSHDREILMNGSCRLYTTVPYAVTNENIGINSPIENGSGAGGAIWDLCGCDQRILNMHGGLGCSLDAYLKGTATKNPGTIVSEKPATLHMNDNQARRNPSNSHTWTTTNWTCFAGCVSLSKEGEQLHILANESSTCGDLIVVNKRLVMSGDSALGIGAWPNASNAVVRTKGELVVGHAAAFGPQVTVKIEGSGKVNVAAGVMLACDSLVIDGRQKAPGVWGRVGSGAAHESPRITGDGLLVVANGPGGILIIK